jgi:apolipoprotein N-acyltransferase
VQPNAAQHLKWRADMVKHFYARQLDLTRAPPRDGTPAPDLVVWPETAVPWLLDDADAVLAEISRAAGGVPLALGILRAEDGQLRNSLVVVQPGGAVGAQYDKHHLVPFGEYMPFTTLARDLGLRGLAELRGPGFGSGPGPSVLDFGTIGRGMPLICYEAVFAHDVNAMPMRADFLLQITNDAWFGTWAGPQQHLAQARMRAIEQGLPLLRAANTGISAMIDPYGRIVAALDLGVAGFVDAPLPAPLPPSVYARIGDWPALAVLLSGLALAYLQAGLRSRRKTD